VTDPNKDDKNDPPKNDPPSNDPPKNDPPTNDPPKDDNTPVTKGDVKSIIQEVLKERRPPDAGPTRRVDLEEAAKRAVEEATARLQKDKEQDELKGKVDKLEKIVETPPVKLGRLTKIFWGDDTKERK